MVREGRPRYKQLGKMGLENLSDIHWNLATPRLYEQPVRQREGLMAHLGPLVVRTGITPAERPRTSLWFASQAAPRRSGGER